MLTNFVINKLEGSHQYLTKKQLISVQIKTIITNKFPDIWTESKIFKKIISRVKRSENRSLFKWRITLKIKSCIKLANKRNKKWCIKLKNNMYKYYNINKKIHIKLLILNY